MQIDQRSDKETVMAARKFFATNETTALKLVLDTQGPVPIDEIKQELLSVSIKHSLPPKGGLFDVAMAAVDGPTSNQLGGIYVQFEKEEEVISELMQLGYEIERT
jgi:hypothetical protein